jgi:DNA-binding NarL/FixJ family response regulator
MVARLSLAKSWSLDFAGLRPPLPAKSRLHRSRDRCAEMNRNSVVVVGPDLLVAAGIECLLDTAIESFDAIRGGRTPEDAAEAMARTETSIVLAYVSSPATGGSDLIPFLRDRGLHPELAAVVEPTDISLARACLVAGARACIATTSPTEALGHAIRACRDRSIYIAAEIDDKITDPVFTILTPRERDVLRGIAEGATSMAIATHLGIAYKTVDTHRQSIARKLASRGIADLVKHAIRAGLTDLSTGRPAHK